ncbi:MAG: class I SAM-dependent methyltransferase, partial [Clostridia bacterium]|nr:class I SAM-dependent methyltransferase [Clostridia bacterium]
MTYQRFAAVYDFLMRDVDYNGWADYYSALVSRHGITLNAAADCGCGTGSITIALARRGVRMTGVDKSPEMLSVACEKARHNGVSIQFVRQDMRRLRLHRPVDCVFSCCDAINYLCTPGDAQTFFRTAYASVRPGGGVFFDLSTDYKL